MVFNEKSNNINISVYPNPATSFIYIKMEDFSINSNFQLTIYNSVGQLIYSENKIHNNTPAKVNIESFRRGIYFVRINNGSSSETTSFIIQ